MSESVEVGVICFCGMIFKNICNFCKHATECQDWKEGDPQLKRIAREMWSLREDAIP